MLVYLKGYEIKKITKNMLKKPEFGASLSEVVSVEQLKEEILDVLENGGFVYGLYKKREMTICYLIEYRCAMMAFAIGILFGIALDNVALGLCFALAFASSYGISLGGRRK